jgi:DNA-binding transcriptional MocR family regulator
MSRILGIKTVRSFAYAEPDTSLFPIDTFWRLVATLEGDATEIMQYGSPQGDIHLRVELASLLRERGVEAGPGDFIVTTGVTQGLSLVTQALTSPGDTIIVEEPTHPALLRVFEAHRVRPIAVRRDETGPDLDQLERIIVQYRPRFFCTIPAFHTPTGYSLAQPQRLMDVVQKHNLLVVEDDIYGLLSYDTVPAPALKAIDETDLVIYLGGFSKTIMPGLRIGFVQAPQPLLKHLLGLKQAIDLGTPTLMQRALAQFIWGGHFKAHLRRCLPLYTERRDHLLKALPQFMPRGTHWTRPGGGFSCWLTLPDELDSLTVQRAALRQGFAFTPSDIFLTDDHALRICFASHDKHTIYESIAALGEIMHTQLQ